MDKQAFFRHKIQKLKTSKNCVKGLCNWYAINIDSAKFHIKHKISNLDTLLLLYYIIFWGTKLKMHWRINGLGVGVWRELKTIMFSLTHFYTKHLARFPNGLYTKHLFRFPNIQVSKWRVYKTSVRFINMAKSGDQVMMSSYSLARFFNKVIIWLW